MEFWNDFITRENLEDESGMVDPEKVRVLSLNTYLRYIEDLIELGGNEDPHVASEQVEEFMVDDFMNYTHAMEGRYPEPEEITAHLREPENIRARQNWTYICVHANKENWPDFVKRIREEWNVPESIPLKNEDRIIAMMEKCVRNRGRKIVSF